MDATWLIISLPLIEGNGLELFDFIVRPARIVQ